MMCPHGQRVEEVRTFCGQEKKEDQFFAILCGCLLWTALNLKKMCCIERLL